MKQKMKLIAALLISVHFIMPQVLRAQDSTKIKIRSFQIGFFTPLGSNGFDSWNVSNKFSINILGGYSGGVDGAEFSSLGSVLQGNMRGAQFSGLGNIVLQETKGVQFAGLFNIGLGNVKAAQFAGLANITAGKVKAFQASGLLNITTDTTRGFQLAGLANISAGRISGTQMSGLFNYAKKLNGVQLGVFNYTDSLEKGVPVGFLSFVKNGYSAFELGATETLFGVMSFKTGTRQFYNILSVGGGTRDGLSLFAWGYGLGAFIPLGNKAGISIDGICYQVNEGEWFTDRLNLLNKLNLTGSWKLANHLSIFAGVSWNVTVSDITDKYGDEVVAHIAPWSVFDETYNAHLNVKMYPGFSAGIRL
jgi:hypothetical protein